MFLSLGIIFVIGIIGGWFFDKIHLPKLIFYIVLGILIGPSIFNIVDSSLLNISAYLRQIALVIILTRSGLSLKLETLKKIGRPAILMCFIPATFEIFGITLFGPLLLDITVFEALLLGSVLAAVSPAVVVPRMIKLQEEGYGSKHNVSELILSGASVDDIYVIVLFYAFKGLVVNNTFDALSILKIPLSIILGIALGIVLSYIVIKLFKLLKLNNITKTIIVLGVSFIMLGIEEILKPYVAISSLLGIIILGILILRYRENDAIEVKKSFNGLWNGFEILLFTLVGCCLDLSYVFTSSGLLIVVILLIGLLFRSIGVLICITFTNYNYKEKIYIVISYLPKATVQASIGGIALAEGLSCGTIILTSAVISILITASIGAILMDLLYKKLLEKDNDNNILIN